MQKWLKLPVDNSTDTGYNMATGNAPQEEVIGNHDAGTLDIQEALHTD